MMTSIMCARWTVLEMKVVLSNLSMIAMIEYHILAYKREVKKMSETEKQVDLSGIQFQHVLLLLSIP